MKRTFLITITLSLIISGCNFSYPVTNVDATDECIPPLFNIAFPVVMQTSDTNARREIPPKGKWQIQSNLPYLENESGDLLSRIKYQELWLTNSKSHKIYRYYLEQDEWVSYEKIGEELTVPEKLFITSNGTVWGIGIQITDNIDVEVSRPLLSRFNDISNQFESVIDNSGLLQTRQVHIVSNILEDQTGLLWFFVQGPDAKKNLYSFDVKEQKSKSHQFNFDGELAIGRYLAISPSGNIWFSELQKNQLLEYNPNTETIHIYNGFPYPMDMGGLPFDLTKSSYLFFDRSGKLWQSSNGWLDFSNGDFPIWNQVIEPREFVTNNGLPENKYRIGYPFYMYQSSNNEYWFTGSAGITRLNLEQGKWCLVTTGISDVVEDNDQNLWIAVFGHLYKYSLKQ